MPHLILAALDPAGVIMTVIGLGALIFFHELGHFLACRATGTRVEAFSIGFGPEIFGWKRGNTRYRIAVIPLGGYVKMAAENPGDANTGAPDEFPNKSFLQRLFIMSNGVIFNIILAMILYVWAFGIGVPFEKPEVGSLSRGGAGWEAGLEVGDRVTHVNGRSILGFVDLSTETAFSSEGEELTFTVERDGESFELPVTPRYSESRGMPEIGIGPVLSLTMSGVEPDSPAAKAGGKAGDELVAIDGVEMRGIQTLPQVVGRKAGAAPSDATEIKVVLRVRRKDKQVEDIEVTAPIGERPQVGIQPYSGTIVRRIAARSIAADLFRTGDRLVSVGGLPVSDIGTFRDTPGRDVAAGDVVVERNGENVTLTAPAGTTQADLLRGIAGDNDLSVTRVAPRSGLPAERAGLKVGDTVTKVGSTKVTSWLELQKAIVLAGRKPVTMTVMRGDQSLDVTVEAAGTIDNPLFGYEARPARELHKESIFGAVTTGIRRTGLAIKSVALTIRSLVTQRVSARHIGGPITLARATYQMFEHGLGRYLYILALISINLAILNILPIPVLDGGQIVLLCAEKLRGKPLPERLVGYFQMVGLLLILSLLVLAFRNDIAGLLQ
ncbi:MAG: RIP metalloprotease RseP [Planctomycetota bacterium]